MRIRISSEFEQANLPGIRSWFNIDRENTVASLKLSLCASVPALHNARIRATELVLTLEDYELLDNSPIRVLREGDLICLRRRMHLPKRRAETAEDAPRKRHRPLPGSNGAAGVGGVGMNGFIFQAPVRPGRGQSTESSSPSSSSDTSSDTSSNSESTSESTTDSDSDSTSSPSSDGLDRPLPRPPPSSEPQRRPSQLRPISIPPGFGKPETHKRNGRRRKKRQAERGSDDVPPVPAGGSNAIALGVANKSVLTPKPMMMMSLKNKNKRREFKNTIGMPSRITFQDNEVAPSPLPTLVPPSERGQLPPRLFVTSVDVEANLLPRNNEQKWDRNKKKIQRESYGQLVNGADVTLDYSGTPEEDNAASSSTQNYAALENAWVNAPPVEEKGALSIGYVVGWQELGINPTTVTPETMLFFARVASAGENGAVVVRLHRPGLGMAPFGGGDLKDEEEEFPWDKILEMHWRLVSG